MQNFCVFWMLLLQDDEAQFRLECWQHSNASLTMKDADKSQKKHGACSVGSEVTSSSRKCFLTTAARCHSRARRGIATWHLWLPAGFARAPRLSGNVLKALAESTPKSINDPGACLDLDLLANRELVDIDTGVMRFHPSGFAVDAHQLLLVNDIVMHDARHLDLVCTGSICVQDHLLVLKMFGGNPRPISCSDRAWSWSLFCCHLRGQAVQVECLRSASLNHTSPLFPLKLRSACIGDHLFLAEINFVRFNVCPSSLLAKDDLVLQDPNMSCPDWSRPSPRPLCAHQAGMPQMSLGHLPTHTTE